MLRFCQPGLNEFLFRLVHIEPYLVRVFSVLKKLGHYGIVQSQYASSPGYLRAREAYPYSVGRELLAGSASRYSVTQSRTDRRRYPRSAFPRRENRRE